MIPDPELLQDKLRSLSQSKQNSTGRLLIEEGLSSKWEGTQALAIKGLGAWGDRWSIDRLKTFLLDDAKQPAAGALLIVIIDALVPNLTAKDRNWILEYCELRSTDREAYKLRLLSDCVTQLR